MAVWIYAYGHIHVSREEIESPEFLERLNAVPFNELTFLDSVARKSAPGANAREYYEANRDEQLQRFNEWSDEEFNAYLDSIRYPHVTRSKVIDLFIADSEKREREDDILFQSAWEKSASGLKSAWMHPEPDLFKNNVHNYSRTNDGISLWMRNDLVRVHGSFDIFSNFGSFLHSISEKTRDFYHEYFKNLLRVFNSDFILYAHEWSGMDDEDNDQFDLAELRASSGFAANSSDSIHSMDKFYYEKM